MKKFILLALIGQSLTCSAQDYTFIFLNNKPDKKELHADTVKKVMDGHMANMGRLAKEKRLLAAGPFEGGGGLFILNTTSLDSAAKWLSTDPGIKASRWNVEMFPYKPRIGGVCPVGEKYEMTMYSLVRFTAQVSKSTAKNYPDIINRHEAYIKEKFSTSENVITEGIFGARDGGILILKGEAPQKEIFESDPGVQEMLVQFEIKKLWIAKGSFCEK
jgi:uncharacterized protein YciI